VIGSPSGIALRKLGPVGVVGNASIASSRVTAVRSSDSRRRRSPASALAAAPIVRRERLAAIEIVVDPTVSMAGRCRLGSGTDLDGIREHVGGRVAKMPRCRRCFVWSTAAPLRRRAPGVPHLSRAGGTAGFGCASQLHRGLTSRAARLNCVGDSSSSIIRRAQQRRHPTTIRAPRPRDGRRSDRHPSRSQHGVTEPLRERLGGDGRARRDRRWRDLDGAGRLPGRTVPTPALRQVESSTAPRFGETPGDPDPDEERAEVAQIIVQLRGARSHLTPRRTTRSRVTANSGSRS